MKKIARALGIAAGGVAVVSVISGCHETPPAFGPLPVVDVPSGENGAAIWQLESGNWGAPNATPACRWWTTNPTSTGTARAVVLRAGQTFASVGCGEWHFANPGQWTPPGVTP